MVAPEPSVLLTSGFSTRGVGFSTPANWKIPLVKPTPFSLQP